MSARFGRSPMQIEPDQIVTLRDGAQTVGGIGPNMPSYNAILDSWAAQVPGVSRALVLCDGLIGSALVRSA